MIIYLSGSWAASLICFFLFGLKFPDFLEAEPTLAVTVSPVTSKDLWAAPVRISFSQALCCRSLRSTVGFWNMLTEISRHLHCVKYLLCLNTLKIINVSVPQFSFIFTLGLLTVKFSESCNSSPVYKVYWFCSLNLGLLPTSPTPQEPECSSYWTVVPFVKDVQNRPHQVLKSPSPSDFLVTNLKDSDTKNWLVLDSNHYFVCLNE